MGSPPQVRGKPETFCRVSGFFRITPAGAGKTMTNSSRCPSLRDHPRRCGENLSTFRRHRKERGSPPQVRGKPVNRRFDAIARRITPAGAGKTDGKRHRGQGKKDHPRRCGENYSAGYARTSNAGSPPQVRGKLHSLGCVRRCQRITPAGAGKTKINIKKAAVA